MSSAVERLSERHLAFNSKRVLKLVEVMAALAPDLISPHMPSLERHVRRIELRRGVGEDRILRWADESDCRHALNLARLGRMASSEWLLAQFVVPVLGCI